MEQAGQDVAGLMLSAVRGTARVSAGLYALMLLRLAGAAGVTSPSARRMLVIFVANHTVHFGFVYGLGSATGFANIAERGGWLPASIGGVAFYVGVAWIWFGRLAPRHESSALPRHRTWTLIPLLLIWAAFAHAYVTRMTEHWLFVALAILLAAALGTFSVSEWQRRRADRRVADRR